MPDHTLATSLPCW